MKLGWVLDHVDGSRARAVNGEVLSGTVDSFLIRKLTGGRAQVTDASDAARTMDYNIKECSRDATLCAVLAP